MGELFRVNCLEGKSQGRNCIGENFIGTIVRGAVAREELFKDNCPGGKSLGGNCPGWNFMGGICPWGSCLGGELFRGNYLEG